MFLLGSARRLERFSLLGILRYRFMLITSIILAVFSSSTTADVHVPLYRDIGVKEQLSIRKYNKVYSLLYDDSFPWYYIQAQIMVESAGRANAVSPVGAKGLGQFMPLTWRDMERELWNGEKVDVFSTSRNIQATVYYMYKMRRVYKAPRPDKERHSMALCSYNAGLGNCIKAQQLCNNTLLWSDAVYCLPLVTGIHSKETTDYVNRVWGRVEEYEND